MPSRPTVTPKGLITIKERDQMEYKWSDNHIIKLLLLFQKGHKQ